VRAQDAEASFDDDLENLEEFEHARRITKRDRGCPKEIVAETLHHTKPGRRAEREAVDGIDEPPYVGAGDRQRLKKRTWQYLPRWMTPDILCEHKSSA
jgi:hypothetical protein